MLRLKLEHILIYYWVNIQRLEWIEMVITATIQGLIVIQITFNIELWIEDRELIR